MDLLRTHALLLFIFRPLLISAVVINLCNNYIIDYIEMDVIACTVQPGADILYEAMILCTF